MCLAGEAGEGLIWVDFNFVMSQQAPIRWSLNSWAAQANHGHPNEHYFGLFQLTFVAADTLSNLSDVRVLDLSHNRLNSPPSNAWHTMLHLNRLMLAGNPFTTMSNDSFMGLDRLEWLDIGEMNGTIGTVGRQFNFPKYIPVLRIFLSWPLRKIESEM